MTTHAPVDVSARLRTRVRHTRAPREAAARRPRRPPVGDSGRLMIVAVPDLAAGRALLHPADDEVAAAVDTAVGPLYDH